MHIYLALICLSVKTPTSMLHDCMTISAHDCRDEAKAAISLACQDDDICLSKGAVQKIRLEVAEGSFRQSLREMTGL